MNSENAPSYAGSAPVTGVVESAAPAGQRFVPSWRRFKGLAIYTAILALVFGRALYALITFAPSAELYSHILLIPFISAYLIWIKRGQVVMESKPNRRMAWLPAAVGILVLAGYRVALGKGWVFGQADYLAVMTCSFLLFLFAGCFIFVEANYLKSLTFPLAFLFFCVPFPEVVRFKIETFFQFGSADVAYVMLKMSGMPVLQIGTRFLLPSMSIEVAPECSGVHSSLILFITSVLAAHLFLKTTSRRTIFVLSVIPLAFLRNGFRVFTIAQLCVRIGPQMIDSWIHHHGGPVFFVLSLVPLFFLLMYLTKSETRKEQAVAVSARK